MGQQEIIDLLSTSPGYWFMARDIHCCLDISLGTVLANLKKMRRSSAIRFKLVKVKTDCGYRRVYIYSYNKAG